MTIIGGRKPVLEALNSGVLIERIYLLRGVHGGSVDAIRQLARSKNVLVTEAEKASFDKLSHGTNSQGVVALVGEKEYIEIDDLLAIPSGKNEKAFFLVFDEIEDPHNLGALIRTAVCFGAHGGIIPKHHASPVNETVSKASAGASARFPLAKVTNIVAAVEELKKHGIWVVGTDAESTKNFTDIDYTLPVAIVMGNEGKGIRRLVKEKCDFVVSIPMSGAFESLNVSVAGGLIMHEVYRKRMKT
ncbi:MAG TPA: 23S rRNA (guanosine(2251)-2'-O)-methyltransferase RlmB [Bacteroidota bacterium]|nr:23S rRNA (guanosine(2251)-2'-O)-methyltransferase RlmB [Bacteroidota bacterium]